MLFEDQPVLLILVMIATIEIWLRVRGPLFSAVRRLSPDRDESV